MTVLCFSACKNQIDEPESSKGNKEEYMEKGVKEYLEGLEKENLWKEGKPKKWYFAIPFVLIWILIILLIVKA